jgi:predicted alpha/beta superfamily hydrolase
VRHELAHTFHLPFGGHPRRVRVVVPHELEPQPPALVLFDGQNVLDDHGSFAGGWHAHTAIERLPSTIRKPVLVAIDHGGVARMRELWQDLDDLLAVVIERALPEAERRVGRGFDPSARVIGGASLGGLASLAAVARHPDVFAGAMAMSPSAWFAPKAILTELARSRRHARFYVDVGRLESEAMVRGAENVARLLASRVEPSRLLFRPDRRGRHRERDWKRRLPKALRFLFRR